MEWSQNLIDELAEGKIGRPDGQLIEDVEAEARYCLPDEIRADVVGRLIDGGYWEMPRDLDEVDLALMPEPEYRSLVIALANGAVDQLLWELEGEYE